MVEAVFIEKYNADAKTIFHDMSWRKFRLLINANFVSDGADVETMADGFDINAAFDRAAGREPASSVQRMGLAEFTKGM